MVPSTAARARRMRVVVDAATRDVNPPAWLAAAMVARTRTAMAGQVVHAREQGRREGAERERDRADLSGLTPEQARRLRTLDELEEALGAALDYRSLTDWVSPQLAALALRQARALEAGNRRIPLDTKWLADRGERLVETARELDVIQAELAEALTGAQEAGGR